MRDTPANHERNYHNVVLLGLWSVVAPFLLEMVDTGLVWSTIVSGVVVALLSGYNTYANKKADVPADVEHFERA